LQIKRHWRDYRAASGRRPIRNFLDGLTDIDAASVVAAMKEVKAEGLTAARHLRGDVYEVRADGDRATYRVLFSPEGQRQRALLALHAISKKTNKCPPGDIDLAEQRLRDWRRRGE